MTNWDFEINEVHIPEIGHHDPTIKVRFKVLKDGVWQQESNSQVEFQPEEFDGMTDKQGQDLIKARVREKLDKMIQKFFPISPLKNLQGYKFSAVDKGADPVVVDPTLIVDPIFIDPIVAEDKIT